MSRRLGLGLLLAATACGGSSGAPVAVAPQAALPSPTAVGSPAAQDLYGGGYGGPPAVTSAPSPAAAASQAPSPAPSRTPAPSVRTSPVAAPAGRSPAAALEPSMQASPKPSPKPTSAPAAAPTTHEIDMRGLMFAPSSLTIAVGDSVRVRNADSNHHTFTDGGVFDSGDLGPGATYTYRFGAAGRFDFVCSYHSGAGMTGTITVR